MTPRYNERIARAIIEDAFPHQPPPPQREPDYLMLALELAKAERAESQAEAAWWRNEATGYREACAAEQDAAVQWREKYHAALAQADHWRQRTLVLLGVGVLCGMALAVGAFVIARAL